MIEQKKIELMKKLQCLAERGAGGEKETAQKKLQQLMKEYNIEETDLSDDKEEDHEWKFHNNFELKLLRQTIYKIMGKDGVNKIYQYTRGKGQRSIRGVKCTEAQAIQISVEYEFYCDVWKEEQEFLLECFIQKHRIFQTDKDKVINPDHNEKMSEKEMKRMQMAIWAMQDKSMIQRIEEQ